MSRAWWNEWWLAKGAIGLTGKPPTTGPGKEGKWARGLLFRRRDTLSQCTLALLLLYSMLHRERLLFSSNYLPFFPTGERCTLTTHGSPLAAPEAGDVELHSGTWPSRGGTCSYTTWTCSTGRGGRVRICCIGNDSSFSTVVVLRVRTYRTRELQPEHWSLLTYHELAKSWLPTVSKYPWCCATSFLPFLATLVVVGTNKSPRGAGSKINICVFATSRDNTRV